MSVNEIDPTKFKIDQLGGLPDNIYFYHDEKGKIVGAICRYENKGKKEIRPFKITIGDFVAVSRSAPSPRRLYNLHKITADPDKPILIVEGEKAAEAATKIFPDYVATTTMFGAKSPPEKSDFSPLKERNVTIWPDNDAAGESYAQAVVDELLRVKASSIRIVQVPLEFPAKWDLADSIPEGYQI